MHRAAYAAPRRGNGVILLSILLLRWAHHFDRLYRRLTLVVSRYLRLSNDHFATRFGYLGNLSDKIHIVRLSSGTCIPTCHTSIGLFSCFAFTLSNVHHTVIFLFIISLFLFQAKTTILCFFMQLSSSTDIFRYATASHHFWCLDKFNNNYSFKMFTIVQTLFL